MAFRIILLKKVQQKYSFQGVPNDENSRKFRGVGGCDKQPLEKEIPAGSGSKVKVPSVKGKWGGGGGRGVDIFWNYTIQVNCLLHQTNAGRLVEQ